MIIKRVRIQNFRCLEDVEIEFDRVTTLIGPNGAGKSSILRALDWFFNGSAALVLDEEDVFAAAKQKRIRVEVEFCQLTEKDRENLGKYAPEGNDTTTVWRTWENGEDKVSGKALAYLPFEKIRELRTATDRKSKYNEVRDQQPELGLPSVGSDSALTEAMNNWEKQNSDKLEDAEVSDTNFFGFVGQGKMSGLFDFIFVSADMRADEETSDNKTAVLGKILERAIDRASADEALAKLAVTIESEHNKIYAENFSEQLGSLSEQLTKEVKAFTANRTVTIGPQNVQVRPQKAQFRVRVKDEQQKVDTAVERQGHGFQRALLIAALKLLSEHGKSPEEKGTICLVIEEPELFQHPIQAKNFASILRGLAENENHAVQVAYATHSPLFIEARCFHQIRRLWRDDGGKVEISKSTVEDVIKSLRGFVAEDTIKKQIDGVCLERLPMAFFSEKTILMEGPTDAAIIEGCSLREKERRLDIDGIVAAAVGGKTELLLPSAILKLLRIRHFVIFDADLGYENRARNNGKDEKIIQKEKINLSNQNKTILRYFGAIEQEWPNTSVSSNYAIFQDNIETILDAWKGWREKRDELVGAGLGYEKKNWITYRDVAKKCEAAPPEILTEILVKIRAL